jgi:hypothetical protein
MKTEASKIREQILEEFPSASPGFVDILIEALEIHAKKRNDYSGKNFVQVFSEFETVGKFHDIKRKYDRMYNKIANKAEYQVNESLEDTALDLGNYAFLFLEYLRAMKK